MNRVSLDINLLRRWIGRSETTEDQVTLAPLRGLAATLDRTDIPMSGAVLPTCWHWLYFLPAQQQSEIGTDGHPEKGGFLPPVPLARRMWAGSQMSFHMPMHAGQRITRTSRIADVRLKEGRAGPLVFVNVYHEIRAEGDLAITERQDIVYRDLPSSDELPSPSAAAPSDECWSRRIDPDEVMLFRYSALTFNAHRIHYDRSYVTEVEGYSGLVVHGPLIATLLLDLLRREMPEAAVSAFSFRAVKPMFDVDSFVVCGRLDSSKTVKLWARTSEGQLAMDASATLT